jgi:hypothetical protein
MAQLTYAGLPLSFALLLASGCGSDKSAASATDSAEAGTAGETSDESEDTGAPFEPIPALGIQITEVEANPGVAVPITTGADWVDGNGRAARLPRDRDTLIRVQYTIDDDWVPREIEARLLLEHGDGSTETLTQRKVIEEDSNPNFIDSGFYWGLVAEEEKVKPGLKFQVQLWEVDEGGEELSEGVHTSPASGPAFVGIEDHPMEMNVMFVPISYNGLLPDITEEDKTYMVENGLLQHNPLQKVNYEWHDYVVYDEVLDELGNLLPVMAQLRSAEGNFASNWYYSALVQTGSSGVSGTAGIARLVGTQMGADRVNAVVWFNTGSSTNTLVHEIGHNQSFSHVACEGGDYPPGQEPGTDHPDFPLGRIMTYGFGIRDFQMYRPELNFDYMGYCDPSWVSAWTWDKEYYQISTLTAWDYDDGGQLQLPPPKDVLKAIIYEDGSGDWWTGPGSLDAEHTSGNYIVELETQAGTRQSPARVQQVADSQAMWVEVPLDGAVADDFVQVRVRTPAYEHTVDRATIASFAHK